MLKYVKSLVLYELDTFYTHIVETEANTLVMCCYRVLVPAQLAPKKSSWCLSQKVLAECQIGAGATAGGGGGGGHQPPKTTPN
jgi:hypothetical protein